MNNIMLNNFELLKQYIIPADVLTAMLKIYELLGKSEIYEETLSDRSEILKKQCLEKDTFFLARFIGVKVTDTRMRLLITKDSQPRNKEEVSLKGIKEVLNNIRLHACEYSFNGSDILDYLNKIYGKSSVRFSVKNAVNSARKEKMPISTRLSYEKTLEVYHEYCKKDTFEHLHLAIVAFLEMTELEPYSDHNDVACLLALYYMILQSNVNVYQYISFFEQMSDNYETLKSEVNKAVINYPFGYFQLSNIIRFLFDLITKSYDELKTIVRSLSFQDQAFKSDNIEQTIMKLPYSFSKDDIRHQHPNASLSTINRVLSKMRDENIIKPLGTGRSARWIKIIEEDDPRNIFGKNYDK